MFTFLKTATPAAEVADALWTVVRDSELNRELAAVASEHRSRFEEALDEVVYFRSFTTDLAIHRVFEHRTAEESALRESFLQRLRDYAIARRCAPCPDGDWLADIPIWHIHSPGRDTGDPLQHLSDRFDLYIAAMRRPRKAKGEPPVVGVLCGLCDARDIAFSTMATACFVNDSSLTQEFLRKIRVKP
jgi:hypothetical protein